MCTLLVVMAHPDDAELLCYGTIKRYAEKGYDCHLVIATKGEQAVMTQAPKGSRIAETEDAFKNIDIKISCLNFPDGFLRHEIPLMTALQKQIETIKPTIIITHNPGYGGLEHQDHDELGKATYSAAIRYGTHLKKLLFAEPLYSSMVSFQANVFINIDKYYQEKIASIKSHLSQEGKFYTDERHLEIRANVMAPYLNIMSGERFKGKYESFYQAYEIKK